VRKTPFTPAKEKSIKISAETTEGETAGNKKSNEVSTQSSNINQKTYQKTERNFYSAIAANDVETVLEMISFGAVSVHELHPGMYFYHKLS
jgi:hypothetical protein